MDGFQVLKASAVRMDVQIPILMVTARTGVDDTVQGLEGGANDYIAKPFRFEELLARVKLRAREATAGAGSVSADVLQLGDLSLDLRTRIAGCTVDGQARSGRAVLPRVHDGARVPGEPERVSSPVTCCCRRSGATTTTAPRTWSMCRVGDLRGERGRRVW